MLKKNVIYYLYFLYFFYNFSFRVSKLVYFFRPKFFKTFFVCCEIRKIYFNMNKLNRIKSLVKLNV